MMSRKGSLEDVGLEFYISGTNNGGTTRQNINSDGLFKAKQKQVLLSSIVVLLVRNCLNVVHFFSFDHFLPILHSNWSFWSHQLVTNIHVILVIMSEMGETSTKRKSSVSIVPKILLF